MSRCFTLIFFVLCLRQMLPAQTTNDSLRHIWTNALAQDSIRFKAIKNYYELNTASYPDSSISLANFHLELAKIKNSTNEIINALSEQAYGYTLIGKYDAALEKMSKVIENAIILQDSVILASKYNNMGAVYYYKGNYREAIKYYTLSISIFSAKNMKHQQADITNNIGLIYYGIKNYNLSLDYFKNAMDLYKQINLENEVGNIWKNIGAILYEKGDYSASKEYLNKAIGILTADEDMYSLAECNYLYAKNVHKSGNVDSAKVYVQKALNFAIKSGNQSKVYESKTFYANLILPQNIQEATVIGEDLLQNLHSIEDKNLKKEVYYLLYKCYKKQKKIAAALSMHEQFSNIHDSIQIDEDQLAITRQAIATDFEQKLLVSKLEDQHSRSILEVQYTRKKYLIILIATILLLVSILMFSLRSIHHKIQIQTYLNEIKVLKNQPPQTIGIPGVTFELKKDKLEQVIQHTLNETDWAILNVLLDDPVISNDDIALKIFMSKDGIGSSLRRMYTYFDIKESKYKKVSLILEAIKISNASL